MATKTQSSFKQADAADVPKLKGGPGRQADPAMLAFVEDVRGLPEVNPKSKDGWYNFEAPDVLTFLNRLQDAGNRLNCSFQKRHAVTLDKDSTENQPGTVYFRKVPRITRVRKPKEAATNGN